MVLAGKDHDLQLAGPSHTLHNHCDFQIVVWIAAIAHSAALRAVTGAGRNHFWGQELPANPLLALLKGDSECGAGQARGSKSALKCLKFKALLQGQHWDVRIGTKVGRCVCPGPGEAGGTPSFALPLPILTTGSNLLPLGQPHGVKCP